MLATPLGTCLFISRSIPGGIFFRFGTIAAARTLICLRCAYLIDDSFTLAQLGHQLNVPWLPNDARISELD